MIGPSSFDQNLYNKLKLISSIQHNMNSVKENKIDEIGNLILNRKEIIQSEAGILILAQCFYDMADFHPKDIELLSDLFIYLQNKQSTQNCLHLLNKYILSFIHTGDRLQSSYLFFLRTLLNKNSITLNSIIHEIHLMPPFSPIVSKGKKSQGTIFDQNKKSKENDENQLFDNENLQYELLNKAQPLYFLCQKKFHVINWFYPEIKSQHIEIIEKVKNELMYKEPELFKQLESEELLAILNLGYSNDEMARVIRDDDIESFQSIVSKFGENFDFNQTVKTTIFERCSIISHDPTLIEYASFFNSIKIFKHLLLNKADIHAINHDVYSLDHFAIAGGSFEIIHILEQNKISFKSSIQFAIKYLQNDILRWLIDNYKPKSETDFQLMNFNKNNHNKIFDCHDLVDEEIIEYDDDFYHPKNKYCLPNGLENKLEEEEEENDNENDDENLNAGEFEFLDLDLIFDTILTSNNLLALFVLFNYGLNINAKCRTSKKTLLHYAIQKGKNFVFDFLLSNKKIDLFAKDKQGQIPLIYAVKYTREKMFFKLINNETVLNSLTDQDYIQIVHYSIFCGLKDIEDFVSDHWQPDLLNLYETDESKNFCDALTFLPLSYFIDQAKTVLIESFQARKFDYFCILVDRLLFDESLNFVSTFYFVQTNKKNSLTFSEFCILISFYSSLNDKKKVNYYSKYQNSVKHNADFKAIDTFNYNSLSQQEDEDLKFALSNGNNTILLLRSEVIKEPDISLVSLKENEEE